MARVRGKHKPSQAPQVEGDGEGLGTSTLGCGAPPLRIPADLPSVDLAAEVHRLNNQVYQLIDGETGLRSRLAAVEQEVQALRRDRGGQENHHAAVRAPSADSLSGDDESPSQKATRMGPAQRWWRAVARRTFQFTVEPLHSMHAAAPTSDRFLCTADDPQMILIPQDNRYPYGWTRLSILAQPDDDFELNLRLYLDMGDGFSEHDAITLPPPTYRSHHLEFIVFLPPHVQRLRLDPGDMPGGLRVSSVAIQEITKQEALLASGWRVLNRVKADPRRVLRGGKRLFQAYRSGGIAGMVGLLQHQSPHTQQYEAWVQRFDTLTPQDREAIRQHIETLPYKPLISILLPVYNVEEVYLRRCLDSVVQQLYPHWELCIADDCSTKPHIGRVLREYAAREPRIKIVFRDTNGHISAASNSALELVTGPYVGLLDHDDELAPHALYLVAEEINAHPDVVVIYSDEDKLDEQHRRRDPYFKPDWNPDLLLSQNYISHFGVYRSDRVRDVGGFRRGYEGSQDYDLVLRATAGLSSEQVRHIPHVLYHWRAIEGSAALADTEKPYAYTSAEKALASYLQRGNISAAVEPGDCLGLYRIRYTLTHEPLISIIIPTRDQVDLLSRCVDSILERTTYRNFEILIVDNQSRQPRTQAYLDRMAREGKVRVLKYDKPFNFAALNNAAVAEAKGDVLALLNNDLEVISPAWLGEMVSHALRAEIGAVGAKLLYPDRTVQHAGVFFGIGGIASHAHKHVPGSSPGYFGRANLIQAFSAVTGACLVVRRELYLALGGLDERLRVAYNDLDFCLRLQKAGYRNLYTPYAELVHHESASRGSDAQGANKRRFETEAALMRETWGDIIANDPLYNPNLTLYAENFTVAFPPRAPKPWRRARMAHDFPLRAHSLANEEAQTLRHSGAASVITHH